jgi:3-hydroxyisobutyrate dehydrogenase-like beta-hydroxyacid dehydrogenase
MDPSLTESIDTPRVGLVGVGNQGAPIAMRVADAGFPLSVWARRDAALEPFREAGIAVAPSLADLGATSDVVQVVVAADADVNEVVFDGKLLESMQPGSVLVIHSTVHPDTCRMIATTAAHTGVDVLDAPVSGLARRAREGTMAIFVGGDRATFERCDPIFRTFGTAIHLGPVGHGQLTKLINNMLGVSNFATALSAIATGRALGFEPTALASAMQLGMGGSPALGQLIATEFDTCFGVEPGSLSRLLAKDVAIALELFADAGEDGGVLTQMTALQLQRVRIAASRSQTAMKPPSTGSATPVT